MIILSLENRTSNNKQLRDRTLCRFVPDDYEGTSLPKISLPYPPTCPLKITEMDPSPKSASNIMSSSDEEVQSRSNSLDGKFPRTGRRMELKRDGGEKERGLEAGSIAPCLVICTYSYVRSARQTVSHS
ncbi:hypothetical protein KC357_g14 [Hortaea werneckii]|nr:hypothetical protein KC357_g14 [Hortaea werneckii]